jgi:Flp pilus assembly protein protease CpaA
MLTMVFLMALPICIADLASFRIPNVYLKILVYPATASLVVFGFADGKTLTISCFMLFALFLLGTGMGDLKLLSIIFFTCELAPFPYMFNVLMFAIGHIVTVAAVNRSIPTKIALAPSVFLGLATYLATR